MYQVKRREKSFLLTQVHHTLDVILHAAGSGFSQLIASINRSVADMHHHIGDGVVVELSKVGGQFKSPFADHPSPLEWKIAFVTKVEFKNPTVILPRTDGN